MVFAHRKIDWLMERLRRPFSLMPEPCGKVVRDQDFLAHVGIVFKVHLADPRYTTRCAAADLAMSRMHLNRRLRSLTGMSTHEFIRASRLDKAREALLRSSASVREVASQVGYRSASHFTKAFRERFGIAPAQFRKLPH